MEKEQTINILWIEDNGALEKKETVNFSKNMKIGEFIIHQCAPIHHPPHKVRAWISELEDPPDYRDHFLVSTQLDKKFTFEQLKIGPSQTVLFEKQSIDNKEWLFDNVAAIKAAKARNLKPQSITSPYDTSPISFHHSNISQPISPTSQPISQPHHQQFSPMHFGQNNHPGGSMYIGPNFHPIQARGMPLSHSPEFGNPYTHMEPSLFRRQGLEEQQQLSNEEKIMQDAIYESLKEARKDDEKRKLVEKKNQEFQAKVKEVQDFLKKSEEPKNSSKPKKESAIEDLLIDQEYDETELLEDFNYDEAANQYQEDGEGEGEGEGQGEDKEEGEAYNEEGYTEEGYTEEGYTEEGYTEEGYNEEE